MQFVELFAECGMLSDPEFLTDKSAFRCTAEFSCVSDKVLITRVPLEKRHPLFSPSFHRRQATPQFKIVKLALRILECYYFEVHFSDTCFQACNLSYIVHVRIALFKYVQLPSWILRKKSLG